MFLHVPSSSVPIHLLSLPAPVEERGSLGYEITHSSYYLFIYLNRKLRREGLQSGGVPPLSQTLHKNKQTNKNTDVTKQTVGLRRSKKAKKEKT